jgi:putative transcriptional regulator
LEAEIESGSWIVLDSETTDVFTADPDELWRAVLRRQPGRLGWLANVPDDLAWN